MPASRSARAMILAPRSCPSRPGLAITTRILLATAAEVYGDEAQDRGVLAGLAEPGWCAVGVSRRGCRPPAVARLRPRRARAIARVGGLAARRLDRDHALASRPLGRPRAVGLGRPVRACARARRARALGAARRARVSIRARWAPGPAADVRAGVRAAGVRARHPLRDRGDGGDAGEGTPLRPRGL